MPNHIYIYIDGYYSIHLLNDVNTCTLKLEKITMEVLVMINFKYR